MPLFVDLTIASKNSMNAIPCSYILAGVEVVNEIFDKCYFFAVLMNVSIQ